MKKSVLLLAIMSLSVAIHAKDVFNWKDGRGVNNYSDVPRNLKPSSSNLLNVNTQTVSTPAPAAAAGTPTDPANASIAEQQMQLSQQVAARNKAIEEQNKQIDEQNRIQKEDNCKTARLNRSIAESARTDNRDALLSRYDADIQKFCN